MPRITVQEQERPSNAALWARGVGAKVGYLLFLTLVVFALLRLLAYAEGFEWAEVSLLGALAVAALLDVVATVFRD